MRSDPAPVATFARPSEGRLLAGVAAALAQGLGVDVTLVRLVLLLLGFASGLGILAYAVLWLGLPSEVAPPAEGTTWLGLVKHNARHLAYEARLVPSALRDAWSRTDSPAWPRPLSRRWIALGLIVAGVTVFCYSLGLFHWLGTARVFGLAAVAAGAAILMTLAKRRDR